MKRSKQRLLGQHFLNNKKISEAIVHQTLALASHYHCPTLLEVGPGKGALTSLLLSSLPRDLDFWMIEKDMALSKRWEAEAHAHPSAHVASADFLEWWADQSRQEFSKLRAPLGVVSNLPYSVGTLILLNLVQQAYRPAPGGIPFMVVMLQKEVADRLTAELPNRNSSSLTLLVQNYYQAKRLIRVGRGSFTPPPQVDSEVIVLERRSRPLISDDFMEVERMGRAFYKHRRKILRSCLAGTNYLKSVEESGISLTRRAEELTWDDWLSIAKKVRCR